MTIERIKEIALKHGLEMTDDEASHFLSVNADLTDEMIAQLELDNVDLTKTGCPNDLSDPPAKTSGTVGLFKLKNSSGFVARMQIKWSGFVDVEEGGKIIRKEITGTYETKTDTLAADEDNVNLSTVDKVPDGADVWLYIDVVAGYDLVAKERFTLEKSSSKQAEYKVKGCTARNNLEWTNRGTFVENKK